MYIDHDTHLRTNPNNEVYARGSIYNFEVTQKHVAMYIVCFYLHTCTDVAMTEDKLSEETMVTYNVPCVAHMKDKPDNEYIRRV